MRIIAKLWQYDLWKVTLFHKDQSKIIYLFLVPNSPLFERFLLLGYRVLLSGVELISMNLLDIVKESYTLLFVTLTFLFDLLLLSLLFDKTLSIFLIDFCLCFLFILLNLSYLKLLFWLNSDWTGLFSTAICWVFFADVFLRSWM